MSKKSSTTLSILSSALLASTPLIGSDVTVEAPVVTRAAFDLGSGKFKLLVADVQGNKVTIRYSKILGSELGSDLAESTDQTLSVRIQKIAMDALKELKKDAEEQGATEFQGIATAVFRKAKNGEEFLNRLITETGVNLQIISQEKEGAIGFNTAVALSPTLDEKNIISWDSGNASFQIVAKNGEEYQVCEGPLGNSIVSKIFAEEVRKKSHYNQHDAVNPISLEESEALIKVIQQKITPPDWLKNRLADPETAVVSIGDVESIFGIAAKHLKTNTYTIDQVRQTIHDLAGSSSEELRPYVEIVSPETVLTRVILIYAVMEKFGIQKITFQQSMGSTIGLLIDRDFWK